MNTIRRIAMLLVLAPAALLAQVPDTRIVQTNQIPENPAKLIEVVGAPEAPVAAAPVPAEQDVIVRRNRQIIPAPALGAPLLTEEQQRAREEELREELRHGAHETHK